MRVVSLLPSATEIVFALGVEPVGVSHECDYPPAAGDLPAVNRSRVDADASSAAIDAQVQAATEDGGVYDIDRERLAALDPDLLVSQGICDVCAVDEVRVREAVAALGLDAEVLTTDPHHFADVLDDVERIGAAMGRDDRAADLRADLAARAEAIEARVGDVDEPPSVVVLDWLDPPMVAGHWVPGLVERAGGRYPLADPGERSRPREWAEIRACDPDVLVAAPCGFGVEQTLADRSALTERPGWAELTAVQQGAVAVLDGHHYVNRPGPRLVETLALLASVIHPDAVDPPDPAAVRQLATPGQSP